MLSVDSKYRGSNVVARLVSALVHHAFQMGQDHLFIYTKPESAETFGHLGFYEITRTDHVALLENRKKSGIEDHLKPLADDLTSNIRKKAKIGAVVVNCNPIQMVTST